MQRQLKEKLPTLIAIPDCVEVNIVLVVGKKEKAEPGVKGVDGYDEKDPHYVPLLLGRAVVSQMHVDLKKKKKRQTKMKYRDLSLDSQAQLD